MSEVKGQLLGVVLVIALFGILATSLKTVFKNQVSDINDNVGTSAIVHVKYYKLDTIIFENKFQISLY